jgi:TPR repeat protein
MYFSGALREDDASTKAVFWLKKAVAQGHIAATQLLSQCYEEGIGVSRDRLKAEELLASVEAELGPAIETDAVEIEEYLEDESKNEKSPQQRREEDSEFELDLEDDSDSENLVPEDGNAIWETDFEIPAALDDPEEEPNQVSGVSLVGLLEDVPGKNREDEAAPPSGISLLSLLEESPITNSGTTPPPKLRKKGQAAREGEIGIDLAGPEAWYEYGRLFDLRGTKQDDARAFEWYLKAAEQNHPGAQFALASMYDNGRGVKINHAEAVKWCRRAAELGNVGAQFNLGVMYANGQGVKKDEAEAVKWYRKAAEQNDAAAQSSLGLMYAKGQGVPKDDAEAVKWYRKAAAQGQQSAIAELKRRKLI